MLAQAESASGARSLRRETIGSPALGQGSNCRLFNVRTIPQFQVMIQLTMYTSGARQSP